MLGIYLAANRARHPNYCIVYQDIDTKYGCDLAGDMLDCDLSSYDFIIATPPCNWWSKANPYYWRSTYSLKTRHLLPCSLMKLAALKKPFLVECVKNIKRYTENRIFDICKLYNISYQFVGRHIYFSNIDVDLSCDQLQDFRYGGIFVNKKDGYRQGGTNVYNCVELWLKHVVKLLEDNEKWK